MIDFFLIERWNWKYYYPFIIKSQSLRHIATDSRIILEIFKPRQLFLGHQLYISLVLVKSVLVFFFFSFQLKVFFSTARYNFFQCKLLQVVRVALNVCSDRIKLRFISLPAFFTPRFSPAVYRISVHFHGNLSILDESRYSQLIKVLHETRT